MVDRRRVLTKLDELEGYLRELEQIAPQTRDQYENAEKRRACERLLQISIETVITICQLMVSGLRLGLPAEENDLFEMLEKKGVISEKLSTTLQTMKGFRNLLVHEYGKIDDDIVYGILTTGMEDFSRFREEIREALDSQSS